MNMLVIHFVARFCVLTFSASLGIYSIITTLRLTQVLAVNNSPTSEVGCK